MNHAACSPSSANMWLTCPASVTLTKDVPRPSSKYAREGTAAHKVAELNLAGDIFLPDKITVEGEEFVVSAGMCRTLRPYIDHVQKLMKIRHAVVKLEQIVRVPDTDGMVWGTMDCGVYVGAYESMFITDLKYGKGHFVHADSAQLKLYALGFAAQMHANEVHTPVTLTICQPRVGDEPIRSHETTLGELWHWSDFHLRPAVLRIIDGDTSEHAGPHCRWCVRRSECKAFAALHQSRAADVFDDLEEA